MKTRQQAHRIISYFNKNQKQGPSGSLAIILLANFVLAFLYASIGHITIHFFSENHLVVPTIFIPEGIALAAAIYYGVRIIPGIFVGQFILLWLNHVAFIPTITISAINSTEAILAIVLVEKLKINPRFGKISDLIKFDGLVLLILSPFSSLLGNLVLTPNATFFNHIENLVSWWIGNGMAQVIIPPILLSLFHQPKQFTFAIKNVLMVMLLLTMIFIKFTFSEIPTWAFISLIIPLITFIAFHSKLHEFCFYMLINILYLLAEMTELTPQVVTASNLLHLDFILLAITISHSFLATLVTQNKEATNQISALSKKQYYLLQNNPAIVYACRPFGDYGATYISPNIEHQFGFTPEQFLSRPDFWLTHIHSEDRPKVLENLPLLFKHFSHTHTYRFQTASGEYLWVEDRLNLLFDDNGNPKEIVGSLMVISHLINEEFEINEVEKDLIQIIQNSPNPMVLNDISENPRILVANRQFVKTFGYEIEEIPTVEEWAKQAYPNEQYRKKIFNEWYRRIQLLKANEVTQDTQEVIVTCKDQSKKVVLISANNIRNYTLVTLIDVTAIRESQRHAESQKKSSEIHFDLNLTNLVADIPNQASAYNDLAQLRASFIKEHGNACVILIELDQFKFIIDNYGAKTSDLMLVNVSIGIKKILNVSHKLYRFNHDSFLILADKMDIKKAKKLATDIMKLINQGFHHNNRVISLSACIGILEFSHQTSPTADLITQVLGVKDKAKARGQNSIEAISKDSQLDNLKSPAILKELRQALTRHEFVVYFQPQIDLTSGRIIGAEALLRWFHPQHGIIQPEIFIPLAEENNLIGPIGKYVLLEACKQAKEWLKQGIFLSSISVNLSPLQFNDRYFKKFVLDTLTKMNLDPSLLDLEFTESVLIYDNENILKTIAHLRSKGIKLSVDDFGTGYSSMSYLSMFEVDRIKIDKSFVLKMLHSKEDYAIVQSIIELAKRLSIEVIAEGVEDIKTLKALNDLGCHGVQGSLISHAIDANQFADFYKQYENNPLKL